MHYNNSKTLVLFFILAISSLGLKAQVKKDTLVTADAIIYVDGTIVYGKVVEVDPANVKYRINNLVNGPIITLPSKMVYAILYSNSTTMIITPKFGDKKTNGQSSLQNGTGSSDSKSDTTNKFKKNIGNGSLKIGAGFSNDYSAMEGVGSLHKAASAPSITVSYQFAYNKFLILGASLGYASFNYDLNVDSPYDGIDISQKIQESITTLGVYGRYNILDGIIKPYVVLGLNINFSKATINGDIYSYDTGKHVLTNSQLNGFKPNFVARGGLDFMISRKFGLYSDIGTGTSLIQVGVIFSFK